MGIIHAVLLGILGGIGIWDSRVFGMCMLDRPLVLGPLVGLILGDLQTGIIIGASLELVMMGVVGIGSATPPDTVSGSILATVFAISAKLDVSAAVALALPIATLGQLVGILCRTPMATSYIRQIRQQKMVIIKELTALSGAAPFCSLLLISCWYSAVHCLGLPLSVHLLIKFRRV